MISGTSIITRCLWLGNKSSNRQKIFSSCETGCEARTPVLRLLHSSPPYCGCTLTALMRPGWRLVTVLAVCVCRKRGEPRGSILGLAQTPGGGSGAEGDSPTSGKRIPKDLEPAKSNTATRKLWPLSKKNNSNEQCVKQANQRLHSVINF